jgi:NAD(P)-dependent dehydrogenase (short-subunit alcohol dehydrogenase family)
MTRTTVDSTTHLATTTGARRAINAPYGTFIKPAEVAELVYFLIENPHVKAINGSDFTIDGGSANYRNQIKLSDYES